MNPLRGLSAKAILLGWITDIAGSVVLSLLVELLALGLRQLFPDLAPSSRHSILLAVCALAGSAMTGVAGYVAGRIGRDAPLANAAALAVLSELLTFLLRQNAAPAWFSWWSYLAAPLAALLGGLLAARHRAARLSATPPGRVQA